MIYKKRHKEEALQEVEKSNQHIGKAADWDRFMKYAIDNNLDDLEIAHLKEMAELARSVISDPFSYKHIVV